MEPAPKPNLQAPVSVLVPRPGAQVWERQQALFMTEEMVADGGDRQAPMKVSEAWYHLMREVERQGENPDWGLRPHWWWGETQELFAFYEDGGALGPGYCCGECKVHGVKLWRLWNTFLSHQKLFCARCAAPGVEVRQDGKSPCRFDREHFTDQLEHPSYGSLAPAIPTDDGSFWGYSSVPQPGVRWWRDLPTHPRSA